MKLILLENVDKLGAVGDIVDVKPGYARNFLIPKNLALPATKGAMKRVEEIKRQKLSNIEKQVNKLKDLANQLEGVACDIPAEMDADGNLFGSISTSQIAEQLKKMGYTIERKWIKLDFPIDSQGAYPVTLDMGNDIECKIRVWVVPKN